MRICKGFQLTVATLAVCGVFGCVTKPSGVIAVTTPDKLIGTWNGLLYVEGYRDPTFQEYVPGKHVGQTLTFTMGNAGLAGRGEYHHEYRRGYRTLREQLTGRVSSLEFTDDGVQFTVDYTGGKDNGHAGHYSLWWINSRGEGEQLNGGSSGILGRSFTVRLNRCDRCSPVPEPVR